MTVKHTLRAAAALVVLLLLVTLTEAQDRRMATTVAETLAYLQSLRDADTNGFLIGQFGGYGSAQSVTLANTHFSQAEALIGDCPALTGWDLWNADQTIEQSGDEAFAYWQAHPNVLYTLSVHLRNPFTGGKADDLTGANRLRELLTTDTAAGRTYHDYLDRIAAQLQRFEDAGVVILWRPLHEANGGWFWWGAGADADYIGLWRHMKRYLTEIKGLSNLIWVYAPNARFDRFDTLYPGSPDVDVVGLDYYKPLAETRLDLNRVGEYAFLAATGKPFYLTEFGARPASGAGWNTHAYDHAITMQAARDYPALIGALYWEYVWRIGYSNSDIADYNQAVFLTDPLAATCSDLPAYLFEDVPGPTPLPVTPTIGATALPASTATPTVPPITRTFVTSNPRITVVEYQPPAGGRVYLQAVTTVPTVRRVMFYFGATWRADDASEPYTFGRSGFAVPDGQEVRVLVVYNAADEFVEGRFTYTSGGAVPTASPPQSATPQAFDLIVCIAQSAGGATLTADSIIFDRESCIVRP